jgi:hypothetical protein
MNAGKVVEDPARRRILDRLALLIGEGRPMVRERLPDALL